MAKEIEIPKSGERALIVGQTGSGKTSFATYLLTQVEDSPIVIYDTKEDDAFLTLDRAKAVHSLDGILEAVEDEEIDYIVFRPHVALLGDPDELDGMLYWHYMNLPGVPAYIDEIYSFHNKGRAGNGLVALLTRGRSKGITTIMSTQRPAWISRFAITEAQKFYIFNLIDKKDKKTLADVIPDFAEYANPPKFGHWYYEAGTDVPVVHGPIKLKKRKAKQAIDGVTPNPLAQTVSIAPLTAKQQRKWI